MYISWRIRYGIQVAIAAATGVYVTSLPVIQNVLAGLILLPVVAVVVVSHSLPISLTVCVNIIVGLTLTGALGSVALLVWPGNAHPVSAALMIFTLMAAVYATPIPEGSKRISLAVAALTAVFHFSGGLEIDTLFLIIITSVVASLLAVASSLLPFHLSAGYSVPNLLINALTTVSETATFGISATLKAADNVAKGHFFSAVASVSATQADIEAQLQKVSQLLDDATKETATVEGWTLANFCCDPLSLCIENHCSSMRGSDRRSGCHRLCFCGLRCLSRVSKPSRKVARHVQRVKDTVSLLNKLRRIVRVSTAPGFHLQCLSIHLLSLGFCFLAHCSDRGSHGAKSPASAFPYPSGSLPASPVRCTSSCCSSPHHFLVAAALHLALQPQEA